MRQVFAVQCEIVGCGATVGRLGKVMTINKDSRNMNMANIRHHSVFASFPLVSAALKSIRIRIRIAKRGTENYASPFSLDRVYNISLSVTLTGTGTVGC